MGIIKCWYGVPGHITIAGSQVAHQQLLATEDVQRLKAVIAVVAVVKAAHLRAVHPVIGGIEIQ